ncbi:MAG TPA: hypothetical protein VMH86_03320 [Rhizomicrobium sp.]|nr:hypothetical protein [Rhizomicrobium sp.]
MRFHGVPLEPALIGLQAFQVAFLWLHDWLPLGRLNDVGAVRRQDPLPRLVFVTLVQSVPYTIGLYYSVRHFGGARPMWLVWWLWISYGLLFLGELRAWWVPYLFRPEPARAARYQAMFGDTAAFLPMHNGIVPNTLHVLLHLATAATLAVLYLGG